MRMKKFLFIIVLLMAFATGSASSLLSSRASTITSINSASTSDNDFYRYVKTVEGYVHGYYGGSRSQKFDVYVEKSTGRYVVLFGGSYLYPKKNQIKTAGDRDVSVYRYIVEVNGTQWTLFFNL